MPTGRHLRSGQGGAEMLQLSAASQSSGCRGGDRRRQRGGGQEAASAARRPHVDTAKGGDVRERSMDGVTRWSRIRPQAPRAARAASPHQTEPLWRAAPTQSPAPLPSTGPSRAPTPPCGTRDTALALAAMAPSSSPPTNITSAGSCLGMSPATRLCQPTTGTAMPPRLGKE